MFRPDISYFYYQPSAKYAGKGLIWDETKKLFEEGSAGDPESGQDVLYFRGCDTTKFNSNIRGEISKCLGKYIDKKHLDITVFNVNDTSKFRSLHEEGKGKMNFLELPGKFPWSNRIKMLFLFEGLAWNLNYEINPRMRILKSILMVLYVSTIAFQDDFLSFIL
jgi:hypothetical protein